MQMMRILSDDEAWDRVIDYVLRFGGAFLIGALYFLDIIALDVHWKKAVLISWIVIGCVTFKLGVWMLRKVAAVLTVYAIGYMIGALPSVGAIGAYLTRLLT